MLISAHKTKKNVLATINYDDGNEFVPSTPLDYDILVVALESISNDFNTPGVKQHCICLDSPAQAHRFRNRMLQRFLRIQRLSEARDDDVHIAIEIGRASCREMV